ncbi:MAG: hypothetical protein ACOX56_00890 [Acholeplasmataceae bacterium]|jgi:hypothetical protein
MGKRQYVDINSIYKDLWWTIGKRNNYQEEYDRNWSLVHRGYNRRYEIDQVSRKIGETTYRIDKLIAELTKHRKIHRAMNLAHDYLTKEIERTQLIIDKQERIRDKVRWGFSNYILSDGTRYYDSELMTNYISKKYKRLKKITKLAKLCE